MPASAITVRPYRSTDEAGWLRCRLVGFFDTDYYDDVWTARPSFANPSVQLVATTNDDHVVGLIDVEIDGALATIDTIAVHPDARRRGVASALLDHALAQLLSTVDTLDAWTRDDPAANSWYRRSGFAERDRYLHVYKAWDEPSDGFTAPEGFMAPPVTAFLHAPIEQESRMRARYRRVHICRRYVRSIAPGFDHTR
jgi:ribosomal protein S18 acetylase RimI-like enzyme